MKQFAFQPRMKTANTFFSSASASSGWMLLMLCLILLVSTSAIAQVKFDPVNPDRSEKTVKKLITAKLDDLKKNNVKKVVIFSCKGEFVLSKTVAPDAFVNVDVPEYKREEFTRREGSRILDQLYCVDMTTRLLDSVVALFNNAGIEVVAPEVWQQHPVYQEMLKIMLTQDADEASSYNAWTTMKTTVRTLTVPAFGYRLEPENILKMLKYVKISTQDKGKILEDNNAQAFCNIHLKVDGLNPKPNLSGLQLMFETGLKKYDSGQKDKEGNKKYVYSLASFPQIYMTDILEYPISSVKDGRLNPDLFDLALQQMQTYVLSLFKDKITATE
ncbi:MAG: hypothetical protein FJY10_07980 [Bacteroidetes bacterium]|nr:hypothetical protein [Bacteroidota bacterium]